MIKMIISAHLSELHRFVRVYCNRNALFVVKICNKLCVYHTYKGRRQKNCFFFTFVQKSWGRGSPFFYLLPFFTWNIFGHLTLIGRCFELKCGRLGWQGLQIVTRRYFTKYCRTQLGRQSWRKRYYPLLMLLAPELRVKWVNLLDIYCELGLCTGQKAAQQDCLLHYTAKWIQSSWVWLTLPSFMPDERNSSKLEVAIKKHEKVFFQRLIGNLSKTA